MKNTIKLTLSTSAVALLAGFATPTVTPVAKLGHTGLSCAQMQNEFADF
jgi:hypothetical protein